MTRRSRTVLVCAGLALATGIVEPLLEVAWKCRAGFETSEACVWGRSYLPLGRVAGLVIVAPITFAALWTLGWGWRRVRRDSHGEG